MRLILWYKNQYLFCYPSIVCLSLTYARLFSPQWSLCLPTNIFVALPVSFSLRLQEVVTVTIATISSGLITRQIPVYTHAGDECNSAMSAGFYWVEWSVVEWSKVMWSLVARSWLPFRVCRRRRNHHNNSVSYAVGKLYPKIIAQRGGYRGLTTFHFHSHDLRGWPSWDQLLCITIVRCLSTGRIIRAHAHGGRTRNCAAWA